MENNNNEALWHIIHIDAARDEHPDALFDAIRRGTHSKWWWWEEAEDERGLRGGGAASSPSSLKSHQHRHEQEEEDLSGDILVEDAFVDESDAIDSSLVDDPEDLEGGVLEDGNETTTTTVGFNVSVDTEYNVSEVVTFEDGNNDTSQVDSSTVIFTTNEGGETNTTSNNATDSDAPGGADNNNDPTSSEGSSNNSTTRIFRPIRIRAFLSELAGGGQHLTEHQRTQLLQQIIRPALLSWSAALRVEPVRGNLTVDAHQLVDGVSCGPGGWNLPNVVIPTSHVTTGVPDTDFVLYISLAFVAANRTKEEEGVGAAATVTEAQQSSTAPDDESGDQPDTEEILAKQQCSGDYLAASAFCSTDQFDRPTAALLQICIDEHEYDFWSPDRLQANIMTTKHEIGHSLGFNGFSLAHFRRPDGTPLTERDPETGEIPLKEINCTGPVHHHHQQVGMVALPSEEILQFRTVRGGVRVAEVVTPSVRQVVRNHFDCQYLPGAELESGEFLPLSTNPGQVSCLGDHWERRLFKTDLMNPLVDENIEFNPRFSTITLAYFADSGWYQVDLSRASLAAGWGRAAGCEFVEETCIQATNGQVPPRFNSFFCNQAAPDDDEEGFASEIHGCTPDLSRKASCALGSYEGELPPEYQYFNFMYGANVGGNDPFMDYCPVYSGFANGLCSDPQNEALIKVNLVERFGRRNSRCLSGNVAQSNFLSNSGSRSSNINQTDTSGTGQTALCLPIACVVEDRSLRVQVDGTWEICSEPGEIIVPRSDTFLSRSIAAGDENIVSSVTCPDPIRTCPTFYCRRDCLGTNRICDYDVGRCVCPTNTSSSSSSSLDDEDDDERSLCVRLNSTEGQNNRPGSFYNPEDNEDDNLPSPDSPLADYYVPKARDLRDETDSFFSDEWKIIVSSVSAFLSLLAAFYCYYRIVRKRRAQADEDDAATTASNSPINPEKHKMMASVVVDLRRNGPNLQRVDPLGNRDSETDLSMTDTEGSSGGADNVNISQELMHSGGGGAVEIELPTITTTTTTYHHHEDENCFNTMVNLFGEQESSAGQVLGGRDHEDDYIDPLAPPTTAEPAMMVRRRHKTSALHEPI